MINEVLQPVWGMGSSLALMIPGSSLAVDLCGRMSGEGHLSLPYTTVWQMGGWASSPELMPLGLAHLQPLKPGPA